MSSRTPRPTLLLSARDPAAAQSILPIARLASRRPDVRAVIVAQNPALEMLRAANLSARAVEVGPVQDPEDPGREALFRAADDLLANEKPAAIITGLSGPGFGIDEALISRARGRHQLYSVQDSDGLVMHGFDGPAPNTFVANEWAARATRRHPGVNPIVVGSLKHAHYADLDPVRLRAEGRLRMHARFGGAGTIIGFFGQPAWGWPGYERTLRRFAQALRKTAPRSLVVYRPHPKESGRERELTLQILTERLSDVGSVVMLDPNSSIDVSLCVPDLVVSCFSSCGIDQIYLQRESQEPLGGVMFLLSSPDLAKAYQDDCGHPVPWQVDEGMATAVRDESRFEHDLEAALADSRSGRAWMRIRERLEPVSASPERVLKRVLADLAEKGSFEDGKSVRNA